MAINPICGMTVDAASALCAERHRLRSAKVVGPESREERT
jgi:hypothetical protein